MSQTLATLENAPRIPARPGESGPAPATIEQGLEGLLRSLASRVAVSRTVGKKIETIVTFGGRSPLALGLLALTPFEEAFYHVLRDTEPEPHGSNLSDVELVLGARACGRLVLGPLQSFGEGDFIFDRIWIRASDVIAVDFERGNLEREAAPFEQAMTQEIATWSDQEAQARVARIAEALDHVDPILVYFEDEVLTNIPGENNLMKGRGGVDEPAFLLSRLPATPLAEWSRNARTFVYCFELLLDSGYRGEELNSQFLSPARLHAFFARNLGREEEAQSNVAASSGSLRQQAQQLREHRAQLRQTQQFYRWVHGISLQKEQRYFARSELSPILPRGLPRRVSEYLAHVVDVARYASCAALFKDFVAATSSAGHRAPSVLGLHPIEALIVLIVAEANEDIPSDIGMSRGLRNLADLVRVHHQDLAEEANDWAQSAYFCAVVPGAALRAQDCEANVSLRNVFKAISARMRFNSWHYMPGHFARARCKADRHFYFPPALADTAEWSDQRHRGHMAAEVRYSIRSPAGLVVAGKPYPGMIDLRLMRREGNPYTLAELKRAIAYTELLQGLYQAVLDVGVETEQTHAVVGFSNAWFESANWRDLP